MHYEAIFDGMVYIEDVMVESVRQISLRDTTIEGIENMALQM